MWIRFSKKGALTDWIFFILLSNCKKKCNKMCRRKGIRTKLICSEMRCFKKRRDAKGSDGAIICVCLFKCHCLSSATARFSLSLPFFPFLMNSKLTNFQHFLFGGGGRRWRWKILPLLFADNCLNSKFCGLLTAAANRQTMS